VDDAGKIVREARVASEPEARRGARLLQDEEWGTGASPERIEEALRADQAHTIKGVLIVHNETATGVTSDVAAIRRAIDAAAHPAMLYVDGVSSIASIDFRMDGWGVDLAVTGSQKGLMLPAGLGSSAMARFATEARARSVIGGQYPPLSR
jgi:alanine-glyoxylate transaminase / serine-glyoxylate transaminase / serine-pyruvate transaminase